MSTQPAMRASVARAGALVTAAHDERDEDDDAVDVDEEEEQEREEQARAKAQEEQQRWSTLVARVEANDALLSELMVPCDLTVDGACQLAAALQRNTTVTSLDLISVDARGTQAFAEALGTSFSLKSLSMTLCSLDVAGMRALAAWLGKNMTLTSLYFASNNFGAEAACVLAAALGANASLTSINLACNKKMGEVGLQALAKALATNNTLRSLNLVNNGMGPVAVQALAVALQRNTTLESLDLSDNDLAGEAGVHHLTGALLKNSTLTALALPGCYITDSGATALAKALRSNCALASLDLSSNTIANDGVRALALALTLNTTLVSLRLADNKTLKSGVPGLAEALESNTTLCELSGVRGADHVLERNRLIAHNGRSKVRHLSDEKVTPLTVFCSASTLCISCLGLRSALPICRLMLFVFLFSPHCCCLGLAECQGRCAHDCLDDLAHQGEQQKNGQCEHSTVSSLPRHSPCGEKSPRSQMQSAQPRKVASDAYTNQSRLGRGSGIGWPATLLKVCVGKARTHMERRPSNLRVPLRKRKWRGLGYVPRARARMDWFLSAAHLREYALWLATTGGGPRRLPTFYCVRDLDRVALHVHGSRGLAKKRAAHQQRAAARTGGKGKIMVAKRRLIFEDDGQCKDDPPPMQTLKVKRVVLRRGVLGQVSGVMYVKTKEEVAVCPQGC